MSGRLASTTPMNHRTARAIPMAAFAVLCGLASGLIVSGVGVARAQPEQPEQPKSKNDPNKTTAPVDPNSPLTADGRKTYTPTKYAIPDADNQIFKAIVDFTEVAPEAVNALEYEAWCAFVTHVHTKSFTTAELEQAGFRGLTVIDLLRTNRASFRKELLRFDGKLVCIRKLEIPKRFAENPESKLKDKDLYEARFVPLDDSPLNPVSIVFLDLPEQFAAVKGKPYKEWVDFDVWVSAAGFFFKTMSVPAEPGSREDRVGVPVLVGKSITPLAGQPVSPGDDPTVIDQSVLVYKAIRDETKMIRTDNWEEVAACNRVLMHSNRFTAEELERHARSDVKFADLFEPVRVDFKLRNVKFEGRLISLRKWDLSKNTELLAANINTVYEGWLIPKDEPRGNPVVIVFTQPLEDVKADGVA